MAHVLHEVIRQRFAFRCGYCGTTEVEAGGELAVDHYHPLACDGEDAEENLVYACFRCNLHKSDYWLGEQAEERILHYLRDDLAGHLTEDPLTGELIPLTPTGTFHIERLHLNRPQLIARRLQRRLADIATVRMEWLETEVARLSEIIAVQEELLRRLTGNGPPE